MNTVNSEILREQYQSGSASKETTIELTSQLLVGYNQKYRKGDPEIQDIEYDKLEDLLRELDPDHAFFNDSVLDVLLIDARKRALHYPMASMEKKKTAMELKKWLASKNLLNTNMILTLKFDGIALSCHEQTNGSTATTRGDGSTGESSDPHFKMMETGVLFSGDIHTFGEAIMAKEKFAKYDKNNHSIEDHPDKRFKNPRNLVAGKFSEDEPSHILADVTYVRYGIHHDNINNYHTLPKSRQLDYLNTINAHKVNYVSINSDTILNMGDEELSELLASYFRAWSDRFEADGLIIEVDDYQKREDLGRETNGNPAYAVAYKGKFEDFAYSPVIAIHRQISKQGYIKPVVEIKPITLNGVSVSRINPDNERFLLDYGIGVGSNICVKRSGMVIPRICEVEGVVCIPTIELNALRKKYDKPESGSPNEGLWDIHRALGIQLSNYESPREFANSAKWNNSFIELELIEKSNNTIKIQQTVAFMEILEVEQVSDKTIEDFFAHGYDSIEKIVMDLSQSTMASWDGWGDRKAEIAFTNMHSKFKNVPIEKLMHASGFFVGLGSKRLAPLVSLVDMDLMSADEMIKAVSALIDGEIESMCYDRETIGLDPKISLAANLLTNIDGMAEISAFAFLAGLPLFREFRNSLVPVVTVEIKEATKKLTEGPLLGKSFCFTGYRDPMAEVKIKAMAGSIASGVSKNTTYLVMAEKGSGTTKEVKASKLGLTILDKGEFNKLINDLWEAQQ